MILKTISPDSFAMICFLVLMQNGEGIEDKAPSCITEKMVVLTSGYDAFSYLDYNNMARVWRWMKAWGIQAPLPIEKEWSLQSAARQDFLETGF